LRNIVIAVRQRGAVGPEARAQGGKVRKFTWPTTLTGAESSILIGKLIIIPCLGLIVLSIATIVRFIQQGFYFRYWLFFGGSIISIIELFAFNFQVSNVKGEKKRGVFPMLIAFGAFAPYLFGCYLFFYEGLWRLYRLIGVYSFRSLVRSALFVILGYMVVKATYRSTEFAKMVDKGQIRLLKEKQTNEATGPGSKL